MDDRNKNHYINDHNLPQLVEEHTNISSDRELKITHAAKPTDIF